MMSRETTYTAPDEDLGIDLSDNSDTSNVNLEGLGNGLLLDDFIDLSGVDALTGGHLTPQKVAQPAMDEPPTVDIELQFADNNIITADNTLAEKINTLLDDESDVEVED